MVCALLIKRNPPISVRRLFKSLIAAGYYMYIFKYAEASPQSFVKSKEFSSGKEDYHHQNEYQIDRNFAVVNFSMLK